MKTLGKILVVIVFLWSIPKGIRGQTVTDYDGNVYKTIIIGNQVWMQENLKSLHYADGTLIDGVWKYNDSDSLANIYGLLYSWQAAMRGASSSDQIPSGVQGVCPTGWHLPSSAEWYILVDLYGGEYQAGAALKEAGTQHWESPNEGATNVSGFTALPGGFHYQPGGGFGVLGATGGWFTSYNSAGYVYSIYMGKEVPYAIQFGTWQGPGYSFQDMSIRCLKNSGPTDIFEAQKTNSLLIFPNPAHEYFFIRLEKDGNAEVDIYDLNGKLIFQKDLLRPQTRINIDDFPGGVYFVLVKTSDGIYQNKLVKIPKF